MKCKISITQSDVFTKAGESFGTMSSQWVILFSLWIIFSFKVAHSPDEPSGSFEHSGKLKLGQENCFNVKSLQVITWKSTLSLFFNFHSGKKERKNSKTIFQLSLECEKMMKILLTFHWQVHSSKAEKCRVDLEIFWILCSFQVLNGESSRSQKNFLQVPKSTEKRRKIAFEEHNFLFLCENELNGEEIEVWIIFSWAWYRIDGLTRRRVDQFVQFTLSPSRLIETHYNQFADAQMSKLKDSISNRRHNDTKFQIITSRSHHHRRICQVDPLTLFGINQHYKIYKIQQRILLLLVNPFFQELANFPSIRNFKNSSRKSLSRKVSNIIWVCYAWNIYFPLYIFIFFAFFIPSSITSERLEKLFFFSFNIIIVMGIWCVFTSGGVRSQLTINNHGIFFAIFHFTLNNLVARNSLWHEFVSIFPLLWRISASLQIRE